MTSQELYAEARRQASAATNGHHAAEQHSPVEVMKTRRLSEIKAPPATKWLAKGWIPYSEITVLVGEEGLGKSLAWVRWAAAVTTGRADPSINLPERKPRDVVVIVTEDNPGEVKARLELAGADIGRVYLFCSSDDGTGTPVFGNAMNGDMATLDLYLREDVPDPALVVVDAWVDTVSGALSLKDSQQARQAMKPWKELAQRHAAAVLLMTHTNRMSTANTRDLMGSTAVLRQKARMVLFAARSPEDKESGGRYVWIGPDKSNVTGIAPAVKYALDVNQVREPEDDDPGTVAKLGASSKAHATIRDLLTEWKDQTDRASRPPTKAEEAEQAIRNYMARFPHGCSPSELKDHLRLAGFGKHTAETAMSSLGSSERNEFSGPYLYHLAPPLASRSESITGEVGEQGTQGKHDADQALMLPLLPMHPCSPVRGEHVGSMEEEPW